jgi:hypothetical protein
VADDVIGYGNNSLGISDYAAVVVAVSALVFAVASFWWLNARKGSITATQPRAYAFGGSGARLRLRFPFVFFNSGAKALIVADMRVVLDGEPGGPELRWLTTRDRLRPETDDGFAYATPFSIAGRGTREIVAEFEPGASRNWSAPAGIKHRLRLQAQIHPKDEWVDLVAFDWWPPPEKMRDHYIAHRNEPTASAPSPSL